MVGKTFPLKKSSLVPLSLAFMNKNLDLKVENPLSPFGS